MIEGDKEEGPKNFGSFRIEDALGPKFIVVITGRSAAR